MKISQAYQMNQDAFAEFFKLSFDPMCIIDREGHLLKFNRAFEKILCIRDGETIEQLIQEFVHDDDRHLIAEAVENAHEQNEIQTIAARLKGDKSDYRWFLWKIQPALEGRLYVVAKDITSYQQLESLDQARSQFAEALLDTVLAVNNSSLSLDNLLQRILTNMVKVVTFNHVDVLLLQDRTAFFAAMQNSGEAIQLGSNLLGYNFAIDDYHYLTLMLETKRPVIVHDIMNDSLWNSVPGLGFGGSYLGCPVLLDGNVIAFINVINLEINFYTSIHARQLLMFANHVAIAINNAYLFEQVEIAAALKEKQRLARELHDSVNQLLFSAGTYVNLIPKVIETTPEKVIEYAEKAGHRIRGALAQLRTILVELHPEGLVKTDLDILLKQLCNAFNANTGISINLDTVNQLMLPEDAQIAYYRIAQESLNNIEKHANATDVKVSLSRKKGIITLIVKDNGSGFNLEGIFVSNYGLKIMHQRAQAIDAILTVDSGLGEGTCITLKGKFDDDQ